MIKLSVKKPYFVLVAVVIAMMLAAVSLTKMTTDLLPSLSLPYLVVITTDPGASPEQVENDVTDVLESSLSTVSGVKNVTSSSAENYSMIMLEFEDGTDMDSALVKVNTAIDEVKDSLPDTAGTPTLMEISMDMMATMYISVTRDDMDIYELTDYTNDELEAYFLRQEGVASVSTMGLVEEMVEVRLNADKIDDLNNQLAAYVEDNLDEALTEIQDAQAELDDGKASLEEGQTTFSDTETDTANELATLTQQMNTALAMQSAYEAILTSQKANKTALETELKAYNDANIPTQYDSMNTMFATLIQNVLDSVSYDDVYDAAYEQVMIAAVQAACDAAGITATITSDNLDTYLAYFPSDTVATMKETADATATSAAESAVAQVEAIAATLPADIDEAIEDADKLAAAVAMLKEAGQTEVAEALTKEALSQIAQIVETRIPQINTELANLATEIAANEAILENVNASVSLALESYADVEAGKITAAAALGEARVELSDAEAALEEAQTQLDSAMESFESARDTALEAANLDALLTMSTLSSLIYAQNFAMPAGYIDDEDDNQWLLRVGEEYVSLEDLENMILANVDGIGDITLADVADITIIDDSADSYVRQNGNAAVLLSIYKGSTSGTSAVSKTCNSAIQDLEASDSNIHVTVLMDQGEYIKIFISAIAKNILFGALLAVIVLAIFLRSVMPTLVVAFSIPFSVLVAILIMYFTGITLNMMSMSGLALGIGMLVDNSIVVIENIFRLRQRGVPVARAAVQGARQVAGAIIASTLTTVCVFLPMVFTTGTVRDLMVPFALTISFSLLASLVVALTVGPCMGSILLKNSKTSSGKLFDKVQNAYGKALAFCLRVKVVPIAIALGLFIFALIKVLTMGIVVIPSMNSDQLIVTVAMDEDLDQDACYEKADAITDALLEVDGITSVGAMTNLSGIISTSLSSASNDYSNFTYYLVLDDSINGTAQIESVTERIDEALADFTQCEITQSSSGVMDLSSLTSSGLTVNIYGNDVDKLKDIATDVAAIVEGVEGFTEISDGQEDADQVIQLDVDKDEAMRLGLTVAQIYAQIATSMSTETTSTTVTIDDNEVSLVVVDDREEVTLENLLDMTFETTSYDDDGNTVTEEHALSEFATISYTEGYAAIASENGNHYISVTASTEDGYNTTKLSSKVQKELDKLDLPEGYSVEISGETEEVYDMLIQMGELMALGLVLVYLVMVAQFQSLLSPFIILFTIPLAFTGGLMGILISGDQLSIVSLLGFTVLMGTVVNNGIVFVDYVNKLRIGGLERNDALIATGKARMRPILMTAITTILAMSTMMFSTDITANMSRGMAVVVAGGLAYATFMTLFIVPVMYDILSKKQIKEIDVGDDLDDVPDDAAELLNAMAE